YNEIGRDPAHGLSVSVAELVSGVLELSASGRSVRVWRQYTPLDSSMGMRVALDKPLVHQLLSEQGIRVPRHCNFDVSDIKPAIDFLKSVNGPLVVKPAHDTGAGAGITTGVYSPLQLVRAVFYAGRNGTRILIEEEVPGTMFRALLLDGEVLDVYEKHAPSVSGDGSSTVIELIEEENAIRIRSQGQIGIQTLTPTLDSVFTLSREGLSLRSVPEAGELVRVKTVVNQSGPDDCFTYRGELSREILRDAVRAAEVVGLRLAGVDFVTTDPTQPFSETGGAVLEVNGSPGLSHHYHVADRAGATRVAIPVLERALFE
ncbi:MAG: hypothetical protein ACR2NL_09360, partial [Acidimicrobiia bacterium]